MTSEQTTARKPHLAMICVRVAIAVGLVVVDRRPILDALHGRPNIASLVVIFILCVLTAQVIWGLWKRYA
jgi:hypothetical protein